MRLLGRWNWWLPGQRSWERLCRGAGAIRRDGRHHCKRRACGRPWYPLPCKANESQAQRAWEALLIRLVAQTLPGSPAHLTAPSHFFTCGGDSRSLEQLLLRINQQLGVTLTMEEALTCPRPAELAALVQQRLLQQDEQRTAPPVQSLSRRDPASTPQA
ncbi:acyl carrier protein [Thermogemmatispora sp.]|uniref:acyl carrier protein n=1 Tax=Thermogemmatispora sp. TaxID=1968838 RepID=UPI003456E0F0